MKQTWIILGASSAMARAFARLAASHGADLLLAGRDMADLLANAADCRLRGSPGTIAMHFDARDPASFAPILQRVRTAEGVINAAVFVGSLTDQSAIDADPGLAEGVLADNFTGPMRFLHELAPLLEERACGTIVGVGSVAGDRGRLKNYVYGAAKAAFHTYLSGLRNRLGRSGAHVITVKPGFVDTAMLWDNDKRPMVVSPEFAANDIWRAVAKKRDVIYTPFVWRYIMLIIRNIPEKLFKKMSI